MDEMEESWRDVSQEGDGSRTRQPDRILDTGREAYLRTKQMLDEASAVSNMLFLDEADMSQRYQKAYEREDALDAAAAAAATAATTTTASGRMPHTEKIRASPAFGESSLFLPLPSSSGGGDSIRGRKDGGLQGTERGILSAVAAGRNASLRSADIRPEEKQFCDALLQLRSLLKRLPPGARAQPDQIIPILKIMRGASADAETAASDAEARLRELRGPQSPAAARVAATVHELSLEKDTWALLVLMNLADKEDEETAETARRDEEDANSSRGGAGPRIYGPPGANAPDREVLNAMRSRDSEFRRTQAVVEWLQGAAYDRLEESLGQRRDTDVRLGWRNTLESLASGGGQKGEVARMDPDATLMKVDRFGGGSGNALKVLRLAGQDDLDEEELLRTVWSLVRAGKLHRALRLCESSGQPWRAAAMAGGGVVGTDRITDEDEDEEYGEEGVYANLYSPGQGLWQDMCWQLSESLEKGADSSHGPAISVAKHEAALFAHFAGNARLLLDSDLTQTWEDQAWVRFTSLLHLKVLKERIRHRRGQATLSALYPGVEMLRTDEGLLQKLLNQSPATSPGAIFEVLDDDSRGRVHSEGRGVYRQAQQALVLGDKNIPLFLTSILRRVATIPGDEHREDGGRQGGGGGYADEEIGGDGRASAKSTTRTENMVRSPQLLRFAAHLALVLAAQCPYLTTMDEETVGAIEDVVSAYTQHLADTFQVRLVAIYAATLPTRRRRELYAGFLRTLDDDGNRREALEQANAHMPADVPAILKKVVEDVRAKTVSVAPPMPRRVPEGDMKKIKAMSWLLDHPDTRVEAELQANALARHLVLQEYQPSVMVGARFPWAALRGGGGGGDGGGDYDGDNDDDTQTRVILSARVEAVATLLDLVSSSSRGGKGVAESDEVVSGERGMGDHERERNCWLLLLDAREAYVEWATVYRGGEGGGGGGVGGREEKEEEEAVQIAAEEAMAALEGVLTFKDGWMFPRIPSEARDARGTAAATSSPVAPQPASSPGNSSLGSWEHVDTRGNDVLTNPLGRVSGGGGGEGVVSGSMVVSFPVGGQEGGGGGRGSSGWGGGDEFRVLEEKRKAKEVAEARERRERAEEESLKGMDEAARRDEEAAWREELLGVREACLPGVVFLAHEVAHETGVLMLGRELRDEAQAWFSRAQGLANTIVKDEYHTLIAMTTGHVEKFLEGVERSTTKLLECTEPRT